MGTTANWSLEYPASTGHTRLWEHLQTLADDVDAALQTLAARYGIAADPATTVSNGTTTFGTTETPDAVLGVYTFTTPAEALRYRVTMAGRGLNMTNASERFSMKLRYTTDGSTPDAADTLLDHDFTVVNSVTAGNGVQTGSHVAEFTPPASTTIKIISTWTRLNGTGTATPVGVAKLWAEAIGLA